MGKSKPFQDWQHLAAGCPGLSRICEVQSYSKLHFLYRFHLDAMKNHWKSDTFEVKLKTAQMNEKRKTYESILRSPTGSTLSTRSPYTRHLIKKLRTWPFFVQHTLFHGEKDDFKAKNHSNHFSFKQKED